MSVETFLDGRVTMMLGDVLVMLRTLPDDSVDCVVTSPPYWGLRDYGVDGQIGLEPTLGEHLAVMIAVFREIRRVLKPTGVCWLNYGDCYATAPNGRSAADYKAQGHDDRTFRDKPTIGPVHRDEPSRAGRSAVLRSIGSLSLAACGESPSSHRGGRCARIARRETREYREYLSVEQRREAGCIAGRMPSPSLRRVLIGRARLDRR